MAAPAVLWLSGIYGLFWLGELYNVMLQYVTRDFAGSMGWYLYAVVAAEVVLCAVAFGRYAVPALSLGAILFGSLDVYAMHWVAIPYYTGIVAHRANGTVAAMHLGDVRAIGFSAIFDRLAVNKWQAISPEVLIVLWALYLAATLLPMAGMTVLAWRRRFPSRR
ncbi:MAG: hypothetical protein WDO73_03985 [Ignavibacteriota bacterium]